MYKKQKTEIQLLHYNLNQMIKRIIPNKIYFKNKLIKINCKLLINKKNKVKLI